MATFTNTPNVTLRGLRDYDEKAVINMYTFSGQSGTTQIVPKGTLVAIAPLVGSSGWRNDADATYIMGQYGDFSVNNVQALRYGTPATTTWYGTGTGPSFSGEYPLGITLFDIRELDENTIPLKYNPRKAAELEACISGQTVPIVTRGMFLYSGITGTVTAGAPIYGGPNGTIAAYTGGASGGSFQIGYALGNTGVDGSALIKLNIS